MASNVNKGMSFRSRLLIGAAASAAALSSGGVFAQQASTVEEIVVTGTRIARQDFISNSPLTSVSAESFQRTGALTVESVLNELPQVVPDVTSTSNNPSSSGGSGHANINLRGLGTNRNLVLVSGRRMIGSDEYQVVDVNTIPTALIERVEVITGGASAVYGADAVAGVVNFILKKDFEGVQADGGMTISSKGDAKEYSGALTMGGNFAGGRGNAVVNFSYGKRDYLGKGERSFTKQAVNVTSFFPQGSFVPEGTNLPTQAAVDSVWARYGLPAGSALRNDRFSFNKDGSLFSVSVSATAPPVSHFTDAIDDTVASAFYPGRFSYNFEPLNALVVPLDRKSATAMANYDLTDWAEAYMQVLFTNYSSSSQLAPSPAPTGSQGFFFVPVTNPFIPTDLRTLLASRPSPTADLQLLKRFNATGPRIATNDSNIYQVVGGLKGSLPNNWKWDVYAATGRLSASEIQQGNVSYNAIQRLLTAADGGNSLCSGGFNPFGNNSISKACAEYISVVAKNQRTMTNDIVEGNLSGHLFDVPAGQVGFAIGAQYLASNFVFVPDQVLASGDVSGFNAQQPLSGRVDNKDIYAELNVPIVKDIQFAELVDVTGGFRRSHHSTAGSFSSYKVEGNWEVSHPLRFRGSYQQAVRAPNIGELFKPQEQNQTDGIDPCNVDSAVRKGPNAAAARALCLAQGVPAGLIDSFQQPNSQLDALAGGNPNLMEEKAKTFTVGAVIASPFDAPALQRLSLSVDYYRIKIDGVISSISADVSTSRCFNANNSNPTFSNTNFFCTLFNRRAIDGAVHYAFENYQNLSVAKLDGIDTQLDYGFDVGNNMGSIDVNVMLSYTRSYKYQVLPGDPFLDYAGSIGSKVGQAFPKWKSIASLTYTLDPVQLTARARYIAKMKNALSVEDPTDTTPGVKSTWYFDLTGAVSLFDHLTLRAGVLNLANQKPRLYASSVQDGTDPSVYDVIGRRFIVSASVKF